MDNQKPAREALLDNAGRHSRVGGAIEVVDRPRGCLIRAVLPQPTAAPGAPATPTDHDEHQEGVR